MDTRQEASTTMNFGAGDDTVEPYTSPKNGQFSPLSERQLPPGSTIPPDIDQINLTKPSKTALKEDEGEKTDKDPAIVMLDTVELLKFGLNQSKHQKAVHNELVALLEHEKKILLQMLERCTKFTEMKEENKKKLETWEEEHNKRMPSYCQYLKQLMDIPESQSITQEGVPCEVQQRILFNIVDNTSHVANHGIVQLSMQNTLVNDVDLSLGKLRQFCTLMIRHIENWMKIINTQGVHKNRVLDQWENLSNRVKNLKECKIEDDQSEASGPISAADLQKLMNSVDVRLLKIETSIKEIRSQQHFTGSPPTITRPHREERDPSFVPPRPHSPRHDTPRPEKPYVRSPRPVPTTFPTGEEYFGIPRTPPSPGTPRPDDRTLLAATPTTPAPYVEGRLQRSRATPGQFPVDIIDVPGMGFPIPRAALEKGGRPRGTPMPLTPPSPVPPQYKRFVPIAASSPKGPLREPQEITRPPLPQMDQPFDPAVIPKIQDDLQRLSKRNKKLQELVSNFRNVRKLLTEEMDKAVRLNQKLQRDLYFVAQEATKQQAQQQ